MEKMAKLYFICGTICMVTIVGSPIGIILWIMGVICLILNKK